MEIDFPAKYIEFEEVPGGGIVYIGLGGEGEPTLGICAMYDKEKSAGMVALFDPSEGRQPFILNQSAMLPLSRVLHLESAVLRPSLAPSDITFSGNPADQPGDVIVHDGGISLVIEPAGNLTYIDMETGIPGDGRVPPTPCAVIRKWEVVVPGEGQADDRLIYSWPAK